MHLTRRMRRNRATPAIRSLVRETRIHADDLILPVFFQAGNTPPKPIESMPGVNRWNITDLVAECTRCVDAGIRAVALFPCIDPALKDPRGSHALSPDNILFEATRAVKASCPSLLIISDVALDPYTSHGHDGILRSDSQTHVENDATVEALCKLAVLQAEAGTNLVAPSDMMDGRILAIREYLDLAGYADTGILSYAAKYASAYYGPFRDAVGSSKAASAPIDKSGYQMDPGNAREAKLEVATDEAEGADIVMVKPAGAYLDIIRSVRETVSIPVAAYQVSGEFAQIHAASQRGWLDYRATRDESLLAIKRAGADMILTYFALEVARELRGQPA